MRSDDLSTLFTPQGQSGSGGNGVTFRQGVVVTWDQDTAENSVNVGGSLLVNLPCLNTSEASLIEAGDVVGILVAGATWAIMGRFVIPGTPEAATSIQSITNRIKASSDPFGGTRNSTSWGDLANVASGPEVTIRVGASGRVLCFWSCEMGQTLTTASGGSLVWMTRNTPHVGVQLSGANTQTPDDSRALNANLEFPAVGQANAAQALFWMQSSMMHLFDNLTPGDTTFTLKYKHDGLTPAAFSSFEAREIAVFAL